MARPPGSVGSQTAAKIQQAALKLFARHGYAAVPMRRIASEVGLQAGALYNHFPTKQEILRRIMADHLEALSAAWLAADRPDLGPAERLERFVRFHIGYHAGRADAVFVAYMELRSLTPENFAQIEALRQAYERKLRDILRTGVEAGDFKVVDIALAAMAIIAMLSGVTTWYRSGGRLELHDIASVYAGMALASVGATPGGLREEAECLRQA